MIDHLVNGGHVLLDHPLGDLLEFVFSVFEHVQHVPFAVRNLPGVIVEVVSIHLHDFSGLVLHGVRFTRLEE